MTRCLASSGSVCYASLMFFTLRILSPFASRIENQADLFLLSSQESLIATIIRTYVGDYILFLTPWALSVVVLKGLCLKDAMMSNLFNVREKILDSWTACSLFLNLSIIIFTLGMYIFTESTRLLHIILSLKRIKTSKVVFEFYPTPFSVKGQVFHTRINLLPVMMFVYTFFFLLGVGKLISKNIGIFYLLYSEARVLMQKNQKSVYEAINSEKYHR